MIKMSFQNGKDIRAKIDSINNYTGPYSGSRFENFEEEELDLITELRVTKEIYSLLPYFNNVRSIIMDGTDGIDQDQFASLMVRYPDLEKLTIIGQNKISYIDLSNHHNLEELVVCSNEGLGMISGFDKTNKLSKLKFYNNPHFNHNDTLVLSALKMAKKGNTEVELDVLLYPDVRKEMDECEMNKSVQEVLLKRIKWTENVGVYDIDAIVSYDALQMKEIYDSAMEFINKYIKDTDTDKEKFAIIYEWFTNNVNYTEDEKEIKNGCNGTYNSLIKKECVCQGYTKGAQFLLKLAGLKSSDISCKVNGNPNTITSINGRRVLLGNHSIIKVSIDGKAYYSDITWDAHSKQNGYERKYFLLNKDDISKNHELVGEDNVIAYMPSVDSKEFNELMKFANDRLGGKNNYITPNDIVK